MTGGETARRATQQQRVDRVANLDPARALAGETTTRRQVNWVRRVTIEQAVLRMVWPRIERWQGRQQRLGVGMSRIPEYANHLRHTPEIPYGDARANPPHHGQIVRDEQVGE